MKKKNRKQRKKTVQQKSAQPQSNSIPQAGTSEAIKKLHDPPTNNTSATAKACAPAKASFNLNILGSTFKNDLFNENLSFLKHNVPSLYNIVINHTCNKYRIGTNPDNSANIIDMGSKKPLYTFFSKKEILSSINKRIKDLFCSVKGGQMYLGEGNDFWKVNNPIQSGMLNALYERGIFKQHNISVTNLKPFQHYSSDYIPLIRVYGIGLGYHLTELLRSKKISYMIVYEPHIDLFYTSLFTTPWKLVFQYFDTKGKGIKLILGVSPQHALESGLAFLRERLLPLTTFQYRYIHFMTKESIELMGAEPQADAIEREQSDAGWYEDQRIGVYQSARNIRKGNKFYTGQTTKHPFRAFVIGSGPSLTEALEYIKEHQNDALIFSCGSAVTPLLHSDIIPDFEVVQERTWHFPKHEEKHDLSLFKNISLLKLNVVSTQIDRHYKETLVFQKFRDPGSSLLNQEYVVTTAVNPTVTNAGIAISAALGASEIYLFGVDYGAPKGSEKMHAANTIHDNSTTDDRVEAKTKYDIPGNLGSTIRTTTLLSWSCKTAEYKIKEYPNIHWFNIGEGARIAGTTPVRLEDLPDTFREKLKKDTIRQEISVCFNDNYSSQDILSRLETVQMQQIDEYLNAILSFSHSSPQTRSEIIHVLGLLYKAVNVGSNDMRYLPATLLSYGFRQFITSVYMQTSMAEDEQTAAAFFEISKQVLKKYASDIRKDLEKLIVYIHHEEETELIEVM